MRSRSDLRRINTVMGQAGLMAARLRKLPQPRLLIDLGGGDGKFLLQVARRLEWAGARAVIADQQSIVSDKTHAAFQALQWKCDVMQGDIFETLVCLPPPCASRGGGDGPERVQEGPIYVIANLFLHHFEAEVLTRLLTLAAAQADLFVALEPRRSALALMGARMVWFIGANRVTRHDAVASVRAGFCGDELSTLWPQKGWTVDEGRCFPFSHCFVAAKNEV